MIFILNVIGSESNCFTVIESRMFSRIFKVISVGKDSRCGRKKEKGGYSRELE
jgi:hypothetical protein